RLIAIGPALLNATAAEEISALTVRKNAALAAARTQLSNDGDPEARAAIGTVLERLNVNLDNIAAAVMRRNQAASETNALLHNALEASEQFGSISSAQFRNLQGQVAAMQRKETTRRFGLQNKPRADTGFDEPFFEPPPLSRLQRRFASVFRLLVAGAEVDDAVRLAELRTASEAHMRDIDAMALRLDADSSAAISAAIQLLRQSALGPDGLFAVRKSELTAIADGRRLIAANADLADLLANGVQEVVKISKHQLDAATERAFSTQRIESLSLALIAVASLLSSLLIVRLYVGRNIVSRLTSLSNAMSAIAAGHLSVAVDDSGGDEIGAMGRAVEIFRRNAIERDALRVERAATAQRLERLSDVEDRTAQLARNEAALRIMFDNMHQGVAMFDRDLMLVAWNQPFGELLRLPESFLQSRPSFDDFFRLLAWRGEFGPGDIEKKIAVSRMALDKPLFSERTRTDGTTLEVRRNPLSGGGFVSMYTDITERKRAEAQIRSAKEEIEAAFRELKATQANLIHAEKMASLGQLTAGIAHEIKNPLNFVNNFSEISVELLDELKAAIEPAVAGLTVDQRAEAEEVIATLSANLERITQHGKRADDIVKSMLAHSRDSSGDRQSVDINALVDEALNLAYHGARAQDQGFNITLERDFDSNIAPIEVVPQDLSRVFVNLFNNGFYAATKGAGPGTTVRQLRPVLKVTTRERGGDIEIRVRDNGSGIPPEVRDKLFQPFFTTKPTGEGTGLGLSISYDIIVQEHGGTIAVDSRVGEFTEFTVRLPRIRRATAAGTAA
ncbi:MAG TPA: PAS-domain containing protein, partial [Stellaceae bacterium]|nr:PAS-domain containing protein [Stellaceae bacterium]